VLAAEHKKNQKLSVYQPDFIYFIIISM